MRIFPSSRLLPWLLATFASACAFAATVVDNTLLTREPSGANWAGYGRTFDEQRFSPLKQINAGNIQRLGLAWTLELDDVPNVTTVPLAVDGVIYFAAGYSIVHAVDARRGKLLWRYDPEVTKVGGQKLKTAWGSRGLAFWKGRIYVGTQDGRLVALDAKTGKPAWSTMTIAKDDNRYITGAPKVFNGLVVIGHGGADYGPIRGYVTAYDAETGKQRWRFHTVPGNPADGFENKAMAMAAQTWTGEWWKHGGGGTVWNAMTYDPEFNRIYLGTGNGAPWNQKIRSPGGGDNLFLCSVVALDADTGEYVWHYQTNPGETWDYNSAMDMVLADLTIEGKQRKVMLHAPKNGFFYVIDRENGKLISAEKIVKATWAEKIDIASGRPVENLAARYPKGGARVSPANQGAHSWHPMAFNPGTGLAYIPVRESEDFYSDQGVDTKHWKHPPGMVFSTGLAPGAAPADGPLMEPTSALLAWNPRTQQQAWRVPTPGEYSGGVLTTAGKLVFQGDAGGKLNAYDAERGTRLWAADLGVGTLSPPITYTMNGRQYVSVLAGWMGGSTVYGKRSAEAGWVGREQPRRLLTFVLDGNGALPRPPQHTRPTPVDDPAFVVDAAKAKHGAMAFALNCLTCHGMNAIAGGYAPDLRASPIPLSLEAMDGIVRQGGLAQRGMPPFADLSREDVDAIRHYLRQRAREDLKK
ncbi:PQQ-dependent dehydrogenase, methanol/ethanol family [Denitratisoma oestradiolicum]|uniref:Quinohemoprotein alcohol dehydrogenase ADH IIB n=1 Tax=Denitratisoma oestradiolicum TaxID=311182 RepID=A0A6S6XSF7_9PROT|nr:PQQ-dependent dehydrogenase, methanol/ethanol family [Denitratisoma oestradiolicum]CAB1367655.1 Quinohemoprotein alcohol dehydrogenase ADH IIB [Denitratisoma oestradiolicum]